MTVATDSTAMLARLVAFDTPSRNSNPELIAFVRDHLAAHGVARELVYDEAGRKANLFATIGPGDRCDLILSGHTDVVPIDGEDWSTDPFTLARKHGLLHGRGTEAGLFSAAGIATVVCGPGSIDQAHKPNELVAADQIAQRERFVRRIVAGACVRP